MKKITTPHDIDINLYESPEYIASLSSSDWVVDTEKTQEMQKILTNIRFQPKSPKVIKTLRFKKESLDIIQDYARKNNLKYQTMISDAVDAIAKNLQHH